MIDQSEREFLYEKFLTAQEMAERYGVKVRTVANWRCGQGCGGPPYIKAGGRVLYPLSKLIDWEKERTMMPLAA